MSVECSLAFASRVPAREMRMWPVVAKVAADKVAVAPS